MYEESMWVRKVVDISRNMFCVEADKSRLRLWVCRFGGNYGKTALAGLEFDRGSCTLV